MTTVAIIAAGAMGAAIAARLTANGAKVLTSLKDRGEATRARATAAGMEEADDASLARVGLILSIVPPADAMALAERLAPALRASAVKPAYVDCNAVNVETLHAIAGVIAPTGAPFVDAAIIGAPPKAEGAGPRIYVSGEEIDGALALRRLGLDIRAIEGGAGAASALKMSFAGINKGLTALAAAMALAALRNGASEALIAELAESEPALLARFARSLPDMAPKAYRWVAEMREIAGFLGEDEGGRTMFEGAAALYERLAAEAGAEDIAKLKAFAAAATRHASSRDGGGGGPERDR